MTKPKPKPKSKYTYQSVTGVRVTVRAYTDLQARVLAMRAIWQDRVPPIPSKDGLGLSLLSIEER
jgi:hypothetical protein